MQSKNSSDRVGDPSDLWKKANDLMSAAYVTLVLIYKATEWHGDYNR